jgi:hypothetical protein
MKYDREKRLNINRLSKDRYNRGNANMMAKKNINSNHMEMIDMEQLDFNETVIGSVPNCPKKMFSCEDLMRHKATI